MVNLAARRSVSGEDSHKTFFAAEAGINDIFARLIHGEEWPPTWTGTSRKQRESPRKASASRSYVAAKADVSPKC